MKKQEILKKRQIFQKIRKILNGNQCHDSTHSRVNICAYNCQLIVNFLPFFLNSADVGSYMSKFNSNK